MTAPIERYVRATLEANGVEMILGIEFRDGESFDISKLLARAAMREVLLDGETHPVALAEKLEALIVKQWPGRYWFLEVCSGDRDGWVQVFAPPDRPVLPRSAREVGDDAMWSPTYGKGHDE